MTLKRSGWYVVVWTVVAGVIVPRLPADDTDARVRSLIDDLEGPSGVAAGAAAMKLAELPVEPDRVVPALLKALGDNRPAEERPGFVPVWFPRVVSDEASWALATIGDPAVGPLIQLAGGSDPLLRQRAVETFERIGADAARAMPQIAELLQHDPNEHVRHACLQAATAIEPDRCRLVALILLTLDDPVPSIRMQGAALLGHIGADATAAVPHLLALLDDRAAEVSSAVPDAPAFTVSAAVRREAAQALGRIGPAARSALTPLRRMAITDPDNGMRLDAAVAVCRLDRDSQREFNIVVSMAAGSYRFLIPTEETSDDWQFLALYNLVELERRDEAAFNRLAKLLSRKRYQQSSQFPMLAAAVAVVGGPDAIPPLMKLLNEVHEISRDGIVEALGHLGVAAVPSFITILADSLDIANANYFAVSQVCDELGKLGTPARDAVPYLAHLVTRRYRGLSADAARAIGQIGTDDADALRALEQAASSDDVELRNAATEALRMNALGMDGGV